MLERKQACLAVDTPAGLHCFCGACVMAAPPPHPPGGGFLYGTFSLVFELCGAHILPVYVTCSPAIALAVILHCLLCLLLNRLAWLCPSGCG